MTKSTLVTIAVAILFAIIVREVLPKHRNIIVPGPPSRPDTVFVEGPLRTDTLWNTRVVFSTDTVNLVETVIIADTIRVAVGSILPVRKYVEQVEVGQFLGDTTWIAGTSFSSDSAGMRFVPYAVSIWTAGPFRSLRAEGDSVRIDFGEFPKDTSCGFFCRARLLVAGGAILIVAGAIIP